MQIFKKIVFILLAVGFVLYFWQAPLEIRDFLTGQANFAWAEELPENNLQFSVDGGKIYFFQPQTGRIFVYRIATNRFSCLLTLEKLGEDLKQSRSLSIIEEE